MIVAAFVGVLVAGMWLAGAWLGPKRRTPVKQEPFECGVPPLEGSGERFGVKFYLIAILFVIFDIDLAFLFPWAVVFREVGAIAFTSMAIFIGILALALWYVWKKGALQWD